MSRNCGGIRGYPDNLPATHIILLMRNATIFCLALTVKAKSALQRQRCVLNQTTPVPSAIRSSSMRNVSIILLNYTK